MIEHLKYLDTVLDNAQTVATVRGVTAFLSEIRDFEAFEIASQEEKSYWWSLVVKAAKLDQFGLFTLSQRHHINKDFVDIHEVFTEQPHDRTTKH